MPISREEWEELDSVVSQSEEIIDFLEENQSKAYSAEDIRDEFVPSAQKDGIAAAIFRTYYNSLLDYLSHERKVEERQVEQENGNGEMEYISYFQVKSDE